MEVQDRRDSPPLWLQLPASATMIRQRSPASPIFKNSITLVILIPLLVLLVISFILSFVSHTSQIYRNNIVKNGWDLLNVVLVLFAILCGVVGKLYDNETETQAIMHDVAIHTSTVSDQITTDEETSIFAIFDEFDLTIKNPPTSQIVHTGLNEVLNDDCVLRPPQSSTKPPLPKLRPRRSPKSVLPAEKRHEFVNTQSPTSLRPPPPVTTAHQPHKINNTNVAKKSGSGKEIATAIASLYKHAKSKTKHMTTNMNQQISLSPPSTQAMPPSSRPPPSPFVFHNMFRKATRTKRIHSEASAPPPSSSLYSSTLKSGVKSKLFDSKPPVPTKVQRDYFNEGEKTVDVSGIQMPEFPVPPRMKMTEVEFEYPELENVDQWSTMGSHDVREGGSVLCPSPDVNVKADRFIARLRGEWRLDK